MKRQKSKTIPIILFVMLSKGFCAFGQTVPVVITGTGTYATGDSIYRMYVELLEDQRPKANGVSAEGGYYNLSLELDPAKTWTIKFHTYTSAIEYVIYTPEDSFFHNDSTDTYFYLDPKLLKHCNPELKALYYQINQTEVYRERQHISTDPLPEAQLFQKWVELFMEFPTLKIELTQVYFSTETEKTLKLREKNLIAYLEDLGITSKNVVISKQRIQMPMDDPMLMPRFEGKVISL